MNIYIKIVAAHILLLAVFVPVISLAQTTGTITPTVGNSPMLDKLKSVGGSAGYASGTSETTILEILGTGISVGLSLLGVIFIILIILAGYNWMTAAGDQEKISKAQHTIRSAIIGLVIIAGSFAIWLFISRVLIGGDSGGGTPG
jgi:hypothetical protein